MAFVWNFKGMNAGGPTLSQEAANGMQGYAPQSAFVPQQPQVQAPQQPMRFDAQAYGQALDNASLMAEYRSNQARIAELEAKLAEAQKAWAAGAQQRQGAMMDELDRKLAISRANYGDISGAFNHLGRIEQRQQASLNKDINSLTQKDADRKELRNAYIMMAEASPAAQASWKGAIADMEAAYERKYDEKFEGLTVPTGNVNGASGVQTWAQFDNLLQQKKNSKGNLSQASIDEMKSLLDKMPQGNDFNKRKEELDAMRSQEKIDADAKKQRQKESTAIEEARGAVSGFDMKPGDSKSYTAKNGLTVTCTKKGTKMQFTCGKTTK